MKKLLAVVAAAIAVVYGAVAANIDLSNVNGDLTLVNGDVATGELGGPYKVSIAAGATVTLSDLIITNSESSLTPWAGITCLGDATIILENEVVVNACNKYNPGIFVPKFSTLTIKGDGWLSAGGGSSGGAGIGGGYILEGGVSIDCGSIIIDLGDDESSYIDATGGGFAAGIGGGANSFCGDITISNGVVTADGSAGGAGIGSGNSGTCCDITICGGDVYATGGDGGSGVGSGNAGGCGDITIVGGNVLATGGVKAAGIGAGDGTFAIASCGDITIIGGDVTATGGDYAAGIGTGNASECGNITIGPRISSVDATCGDGCTDPIGSDVDGACGEVSVYRGLEDETTQEGATRSLNRNDCNLAEIDDSVYCDDGTVYIDENATLFGELRYKYNIIIADGVTVTFDGVVVTNGVSVANDDEYSWAGITLEGSAEIILAQGSTNIVRGFHSYYPGIEVPFVGELTISGGGVLVASSNGDGAGIGGAAVDEDGNPGMDCGDIVIEDGDITAIGGASAAGIGSAYCGCCDTITINGGKVTATGGGGAAGIGGGEEAKINYIEINGGVVVAAGGSGGAGIGGGQGGEDAIVGDITINGGNVTATGGMGAPGIGGQNGTVTVEWDISRVIATCGANAAQPIDVGNDDDIDIDIDERLIDKLSADGKTRTLVGTGGDEDKWYETWAEANGLTGDDAAWDAAPAAWGGTMQNAFVFMYGERILDGSTPLITIWIDDDGEPVVETSSELPGREDFFEPAVIGTSTLDDWTTPVELEDDGSGAWYLPTGSEAHFFRLVLTY
ncbi:MAG: hypothetical protein K6G91_04055 [Kiritimatiellae bacterium]|nr:hypothetical protein [Kiritimatiellia bacterium]